VKAEDDILDSWCSVDKSYDIGECTVDGAPDQIYQAEYRETLEAYKCGEGERESSTIVEPVANNFISLANNSNMA
jgi:hypothetical protein